MRNSPRTTRYVVCLDNRRYRASLVVRRLYAVIPDPAAERRGMIRIIDESGADYLYARDRFAPVALTSTVNRRLATVERS